MADSTRRQQRPVPDGNPILQAFKFMFYIGIIAVSGSLSQLTLSPIYGSIPAAAQHVRVLFWAMLLGFMGKKTIMQYLPDNPHQYLPLVAFYVPVAQWYLFRDSTRLGPTNGPVAIESMTYFPTAVLASICASNALERIVLFRYVPALQIATGVIAYFSVVYGEPLLSTYISGLPTHSEWFSQYGLPTELLTKVNLQLVTASSAVILAPSFYSMLAIPAVIHTTQYNPHFMSNSTAVLANRTLYESGWSLLERQESITGYVSVMENLQAEFRVLRCDHSLLGGEFLLSEQRRAVGSLIQEPIYAVFEMLEAVRLVEAANINIAEDKSALVVGLGIGTAPKALLSHGIQTTVVEIDPVVHAFATKYFGLPSNHTAIITDAVSWASEVVESQQVQKYNYILHDVFTGGAEPLDLFTEEFLTNLLSMLTTDGVIAINYAGDVHGSPTIQVLNTIAHIFGSDHCRFFRDTAPSSADSPDANFSNMVVFCIHPQSSVSTGTAGKGQKNAKFTFRDPVEADYLGSISRRNYLLPKPELEGRFPDQETMGTQKYKIVTKENIKAFAPMQLESAKRHWAIMRQVAPAKVWENW